MKTAPQIHYGGSACFSCRAFFRRAHQKKEVPDFKCLNVGIKPEAVLTDGQNDTSRKKQNYTMEEKLQIIKEYEAGKAKAQIGTVIPIVQ